MKVLWHSNAPWSPTGYGNQTGLFAPRLNEHHDAGVSAFYGLEGNKLKFGDLVVYPGMGPTYGNEVIEGHARNHFQGDLKGGLVVTLIDVWVLNPQLWSKFNVASWVPVDHDPVPPMVAQFFHQSGAVPIAMSRFGEEMLGEFDPLYCPHGVDTKVLRPRERAEARRVAGFPESAFVVGVVAANKGNPSRKSFPEIVQAFKVFRDRHNEAVLYLHSEMTGRMDGVNLAALLNAVGMPQEAVRFADQYRLMSDPISPDLMSTLYSACDVLLNPARGEGFGIPVLEAQACGTPVIVTDFSAMAELCGAGWRVECEREWTSQGSWQARPSVEDIVVALEGCYALPAAQVERLSAQAREFALQYDVDLVLERFMLPALEAAAERCESQPVELVAPRELVAS